MAHTVETRRKAPETPRSGDRPVNTFVVRRWPPGRAGERYEVSHVQSGRRTLVPEASSASAWIGELSRPAICPSSTPDRSLAR